MAELAPEKALLAEARVWAHNRASYPGWLVAPEEVRDRIWQRTQNWLWHFLQHRAALPPGEELAVLAELNWRLETALCPIWNDLVPAYRRVVDDINPFPDEITDRGAATTVLTDGAGREVDRAKVRAQWLPLAFGLLRYYREERQAEAFEELHARLARVTDPDPDLRARWCYERCLLALGEMDDEAVAAALRQWPAKTQDPFRSVRRAAVLAEVGQTAEALGVGEAALAGLRSGLADEAGHIPGLSREGWAMHLVLRLRANRQRREAMVARPPGLEEAGRRYAQLKRFGCSPDDIYGFFESRLGQPPPRPRRLAETRAAFEPGRYTQTFHSGDGHFTKLLPAYQFFRLAEEAAQPPGFGHFALSRGELRSVAEWLADPDPVRTQALLVRLNDEQLAERYLSRHRLAVLPPETLARLASAARRGVQQALPGAPVAPRPDDDGEVRASNRLGCSLELLSRVCVREDGVGLNELWDLACRLYREPALRGSLSLPRRLLSLFDNLISTTPRTELAQRLPGLFQLPVVGEQGFQVSLPDDWPDPAAEAARRLRSGTIPRPRGGWGPLKARLFTLVGGNQVATSRAALLRLRSLDYFGVLSAGDRTRLARLFWAPAGDPPTLPVGAWGPGTPWLALSLPDARGVAAPERVREFIFASPTPEVRGGVVGPEWLLDLILFATELPAGGAAPPAHRRFITWREADVSRLFSSIRSWWDGQGREAAAAVREPGWPQALNGPAFRHYMSRVWDVMRAVLIPRMRRRSRLAAAAMQLINEVRDAGVPVGAVLPATLILRPGTAGEVVAGLRQEFANPRHEYYLSALRGVVDWVERSKSTRGGRGRRLPPAPPDLLHEISTAVALRRPESLAPSLDWAFQVLSRAPETVDATFAQNLLCGLGYLLGETAYQQADDPDARYPYEAIPRLRWLAARLARCLGARGYGNEAVLRGWAAAADADPLPEFRGIGSGDAMPWDD
jgi:hypothetical protein